MLVMQRFGLNRLMIAGGLLVTALLVWFATANYLGAQPVAHSILRGLSLSIGQAIEAVAARDTSLKSLSDFKSPDIAYLSILDNAGKIIFHSNPDLIGNQIDDDRYIAVVKAPLLTESRVRLGTGEVVFETQQQLHLPDRILILRLSLHTWQSDQIIRRALTGVTVILALLTLSWIMGVIALRLMRREEQHQKDMARRENLVRLGELGAVLAHEVRTPLAGIKGFAQLLGEGLAEPRKKQYAARIVAESERLEGLVSDLLTYSRQERTVAGHAELVETVSAVWGLLEEQADEDAVSLVTKGEMNLAVACPPEQLRQILLNLFSNALAAMPDGGTIDMSVNREKDNVQITVTDAGRGFSDEALARCFDPFYTTRSTGSGLGLAVCRKIAEGCGGSIAAANARTGGGELTLLLPLADGGNHE